MLSGYDCLNKKWFNSRRKVDSELAPATSVGSVFQTYVSATSKAWLSTVGLLCKWPKNRPFTLLVRILKKGKGSPYSITERRLPELIPVLGSQPAGDVSH